MFSSLVSIDMECEHAFTSCKKISSFARAAIKIFDDFSGSLLLAHPVYFR
jgi:hypothetical protein